MLIVPTLFILLSAISLLPGKNGSPDMLSTRVQKMGYAAFLSYHELPLFADFDCIRFDLTLIPGADLGPQLIE